MQQRDTARAIWVVLDGCNLGAHFVFAALEVDDAVLLFVTTTAVTRSDATTRVTTTALGLGGDERLFWARLGDFGEVRRRLKATTAAGGATFTNGHGFLLVLEQRDLLTGSERDNGPLCAITHTNTIRATCHPTLAAAVERVYLEHLHIEDALHCIANFGLACRWVHFEGVHTDARAGIALFRNHWANDHVAWVFHLAPPSVAGRLSCEKTTQSLHNTS